MLQDILKSVQGNFGSVLEGANLSSDKAGELLKSTASSITEVSTEEMASGNASGLMDLFSGKSEASSSNSIVKNIVSKLAGTVAEKFGIDKGMASSIAEKVVPMAINAITSKFKSSDSQDSSALMEMVGGDAAGSLLDKGKSMLGGMFN